MRMVALLGLAIGLAACKPPPTDADLMRDMPSAAPNMASKPIDSPPSEGALWAESEPGRIIYGQPGQPIQLALACEADQLTITRFAPADDGAGALLALVGNGDIGRLEVDPVEVRGQSVWQGQAAATSEVWDPLTGPRQLIATVPGGGMVTMNPSLLPMILVAECRGEPIPEEELPLVE